MGSFFNKDQPAILLGIADFFESSGLPFPVGGVDLFQLSQHKSHIVYPALTKSNVWVFLVNTEFIKGRDLSKWKLKIVDENDGELGKVEFTDLSPTDTGKSRSETDIQGPALFVDPDSQFALIYFMMEINVPKPGRYTALSDYDGTLIPIGSVRFHYQKAPTITPDQIKAITSSPDAAKAILLDLRCKVCSDELKAYTAFDRSPQTESEGYVWQTELGDEFSCKCGNTRYSLQYLKESMHGMLLKDFSRELTGLSYVRQYGHSQVAKIVDEFTGLLNRERLEKPVQEFIEKHPILLSRFHAKRLFVKPNIVGRFLADFAVVDFRNQLWLLELERPSLQLFRRDGHPTQALMHAYGQVTDWLTQYAKYPGAILDALNLKAEDVVSVRGAVIAGRSSDVTNEVLQRHLSNPPYPNIEFMTCDDLGLSLLQISKKIA